MPESFLILLSAGVMLAGAVSDPRAVTLRWLRLAGIIAISMVGLSMFFSAPTLNPWTLLTGLAIVGQLGFVQVAWRKTQRGFAWAAFGLGVIAGTSLLYQIRPMNLPLLTITCAFAAAASGLSLMDMLLGHAYLNAAEMTMAPFMRLNLSLAVTMLGRAILSIPIAMAMQMSNPHPMLWGIFGLYIGTRWFVGFLVPGIFIYMTHDCIKRRATQSATGILYVAGVLIFVGELIGLHLISQTGLPL